MTQYLLLSGYRTQKERTKCVSKHQKPPRQASSSSEASQVLMLSLQVQTIALAIEEMRGRITRIERHLMLDNSNEAARRTDLSKLERIW